jgi:hypothetical protein
MVGDKQQVGGGTKGVVRVTEQARLNVAVGTNEGKMGYAGV